MQTSYQIHRFRDRIAVWLNGGATIYLTAKEANEMAEHLQSCADDIAARPFVESKFGTVSRTLTDKSE